MEIDRIIDEIESLQPVSSIGNKVMEIISAPDSSLGDIVDIIQYDPGLTANLLKICNSAYFGLQKEIVSVRQAVAFLGIEKVACLIMIGNSADNFKGRQGGYDLNAGELWRYSVASALIAQDLAERMRLENISHVFTSALLKDIGKVILHAYVGDALDQIHSAVHEECLSFNEAEKKVIGIDHAELGARVAESWSFNPAMVDIIRYHHDPDKGPADDLSLPIIYLADSICMMIGVGVGADGLAYRYQQTIVDRLKITDVDLQQTIADFWGKLNSIEELIKLSGGNC